MKKLMAMIAIVCASVAVSTNSWALLGLENITYDGSLEISGNSADNETDFGNDPDGAGALGLNDHRGRTATRVRVGIGADVTDKVKGRIEFGRGPRQYGTGATTIAAEEGMITIQNAYVDIADLMGEGHLLRVGRQYVGNPGDLIWNISPTDDDNLTFNSVDGLLFQCRKWDFLHGDIFTGKMQENDTITGATTDTDRGDTTAAPGTDHDVNLTSIDFVLPTLVPGGKINLGYLLGDDSNAQVAGDDNRLRIARIGINGGIAENMFTYRAEFFQNMGEFDGAGMNSVGTTTLDYEGNAFDLGVGVNSPDTSIGKFGGWLNFLMASGDDNVADDSDESFHDFTPLGFNTSDRLLGEIFGKSNVLGGGTPRGQGIHTGDATGAASNSATQGQGLHVLNIGANFKPTFSPKSTFRIDFFAFDRAEDSVKTSTTVATNTNVGDSFGTELDLSYSYDHTENVNFELGYAMFMPDDALVGTVVGDGSFPITSSETKNDDTVTKLFARAKIKWGGAAQ